jgi:cardiolipin synthase
MAEITASDVLQVLWTLSWVGALLTVPSVLLQRAGRPIAAVSWILALFALPALALAAWWLFGRVHLRGRVRRRRGSSRSTVRSLSETRRDILASMTEESTHQRPASLLAPHLPQKMTDSVFPATPGNRVSLLTGVAEVQQVWMEMVREAEHHLHLLFYIWRDDRVGRTLRDLLIEKAGQDVQVRVVYDAVGSLGLPSGFFAELIRCGGQVARFMPIRLVSATPTLNFRNHRKLIVADGRKAYTGGVNVGKEFMEWQDLGIVISGPGVNQLQEVFIDDWYFTTGEELASSRYFFFQPRMPAADQGGAICETIVSGPDQAFNTTREMVFLAVTQCRQRLWIATPYFVPDEALLLALRTAVYRGVDVRLVLPAHNNHPLVRRASCAFYPELLQSGVHIYEYRGMSHAKAMLFDDDAVIIGSANLDIRSFRLNFELSTFVRDSGPNRDLTAWFDRLLVGADEVVADDFNQLPLRTRLVNAAAHLLSPLL